MNQHGSVYNRIRYLAEAAFVLLFLILFWVHPSKELLNLSDCTVDERAQVLSYEEAYQALPVTEREQLPEGAGAVSVTDGGEMIAVTSGDLELSPGVYRVEITYVTTQEHVLDFTSGTSGYQAYHGNAVSIRPQNTQTGTTLYVLRTLSDAELFVRYTGSETLIITSLTLTATHQEYLMAAVVLLLLFLLLEGLLFIVRWRRSGIISDQALGALVILAALALIVNFPNLVNYTQMTDDVRFHLLRIAGLADAWKSGDFPARMQPTWLEGMGYPVSIMYGDVFLWPAALLHLIGFDVAFCYKFYIVMINLLAEVLAYLSFRSIWKRRSVALLGTCIYLLAQYRLYNIYMRGATGEYTAMAFLPLVVAALHALLSKAPTKEDILRGRRFLAGGFAGIFLSHMISTELTFVVTALICLCYAKRTFRKDVILAIVQAAGMAILATLWYMVPLFTYMLKAPMHVFEVFQPIQVLGLLPAQLLDLFPWPGQNPYAYYTGMQSIRQYGMGAALLLTFGLAVWALLRGRIRGIDPDLRKVFLLTLVIFTGSAILTLKCFPWDTFSMGIDLLARPIMSIQFPYRFLTITTIAGTNLACLLCTQACASERRIRFGRSQIPGSRLLMGALAAVCVLHGMYFQDPVVQSKYAMYLYNIEAAGNQYISGAEYLLEETYQNGVEYLTRGVSDGVLLHSYEKNNLQVTAQVENPQDIAGSLITGVLSYPGYRAVDEDGQEMALSTGDHGELLVEIPAGFSGQICVSFDGFWFWHVADVISAGYLLCCLAGWICKKRNGFQN
ncbi:MAG: hypothetical protein K6G23_08450 [Lachnospiraceae bacterium]|nr:hypothetical protein [Lachnospiraceae bacterium]